MSHITLESISIGVYVRWLDLTTAWWFRNISYESEDGAVLRNIDACRAISSTVQTSFGPCGYNKMVINHLQKMLLTNDAATILKELEVVHPAAKLMVMACQQQEAEVRT